MRAGNRVVKITALLMVAIFMVTSNSFARSPKVYTVKLPQQSCNVKERWKGESNKTVIHIQDAHSNVDAQKNIANIIESLVEENEIEVVGVEGAAQKIDLDELRAFPSDKAKEVVTNVYVEDGILSGAEKSLITAPHNFHLIGIENKDLFRKNYRAFYGTQLKREDIISQIEEIENILNDLKTPIYNLELMTFDNVVTLWEEGKSDLVTFLKELDQFIITNKIEIYDYIHYASFREVLILKSQVLETTMESELETLQGLIQQELSRDDIEGTIQLQNKYNVARAEYASSVISKREFIEFLKHCSKKLSIDFNTFPQANAELKYLQAFSRLDMPALLTEVKQLSHDISLQLAQSDDEKELVVHSKHIRLLNDLTALTAVNDEVNYFNQHVNEFKFEAFAQFIREKNAHYNMDNTLSGDGYGIDTMLKYVQHFYKGANLRNAVLVENLLRQMEKHGDREGALVAGGFHTEGIVEELKKHGVSYMVVTPKIDNPIENIMYAQKMMGNVVQLSPQLVGNITLLSMATDFVANVKEVVEAIQDALAYVVTDEALQVATTEAERESAAIELMNMAVEELNLDDVEMEASLKGVYRDIIINKEGFDRSFLENMDEQKRDALRRSIKGFSKQGESRLGETLGDQVRRVLDELSFIEQGFPEEYDNSRELAQNIFDIIANSLGGRDKYHGIIEAIRDLDNEGDQIAVLIDQSVKVDDELERIINALQSLNPERLTVVRDANYEQLNDMDNLERTIVIASQEKMAEYKTVEGPILFALDTNDQNHRETFHSILLMLVKLAMEGKGALSEIHALAQEEGDVVIRISEEFNKSLEQVRASAQVKTAA
ncbi:hypothetical protein ACFL3D_01245 [Candidatus Omnitrophota bacterium]